MTMHLNVWRKPERAQRRTFRPKSSNRSKAHRSMFIIAASLFALCLWHLPLTSTCLSVEGPNNDNPDQDGSSSNRSTTRPSSPFDSSASSSISLNAQEKDLNHLGYLHHNADNLLGYLKHVRPHRSSCHMSILTSVSEQMQILDDEDEKTNSAMTGTNAFTIDAGTAKILKKMPPRPVTDILIQHFFSDANWIYEMVYPTTFTERYNEWWATPCQSVDDIQFATLLLRLCSYTAQFLPSQNYTADTILGISLSAIREQCHATAISLTHTLMMNEGSPSITRIYEHFFHACYLKNQGSMKESWNILSKAVHEAHELGLHLESRKPNGRLVSEYDIEMGKRTYWNLWLWDKYVSFFLHQLNSLLFFTLHIRSTVRARL